MSNGTDSLTDAQKAAARQQLDDAREKLLAAKATLDSDSYFEGLSDEDKVKAVDQSLELGNKLLQIENSQIASIVADADANIAALGAATDELDEALSDLADFNRLLTAIGGVLGIAAKLIVPV